MTKPSYEEPFVTLSYGGTEAELARVRGLLRRQWISVEERLPDDKYDLVLVATNDGFIHMASWEPQNTDKKGWSWWVADEDGWMMDEAFTHWQPLPDPPTFPQSSSLVPQSAESADIGKLDAADENLSQANGNSLVTNEVTTSAVDTRGSAETGGEKAEFFAIMECADGLYLCLGDKFVLDKFPKDDLSRQRCVSMKEDYEKAINDMLATFPRSSQNQAVSSGVGTAHEGTTADKSGPELLPTQLPKDRK